MKGYSKSSEKKEEYSQYFCYCVQAVKYEVIQVKEKCFIEEAIEKLEKYMSNNLGNNLNVFSDCLEPGVIYGNQEQSSCNEITTIVPSNNDIKSMLF